MEFKHISVLAEEVIKGLNIKPGALYIDGTLGGGGHSLKILEAGGRLLAVDRDEEALAAASERLSSYNNKTLVHGNFKDIKQILAEQGEPGADGILLDLGVSSYQLDNGGRGFSYNYDAPLDMRMDRTDSLTAYDVVNGYTEEELFRVIRDYGEERWAKRIASFIINERKASPIKTTFELNTVIKKAIPKAARQDGGHPSKRTFQAIRIEVNNELNILEKAVEDMADVLNPGGRLCIITFHSLEDRIVKTTFKRLNNPCTCPREFPVCVCGKKPVIKIITKKPVTAGENELKDNNRAHSAKLRIAEKI
ncbi:MAG: 16S rRNA (cytosine(1402)-N(4))-methyltransferase RsmH [Clostridiales bacterium]|nr:16S rRNA (cytosine(1402)-N(4))-methyltransferase RsmH [Clostridiales bacterium]